MSVYERLREEEQDAKRRKKAVQPHKASYSKRVEHDRKKYRAWRYYRAAARNRKTAEKELNDGTKA